jgi:type IV pilus assembly protein PilE
VRYFTEARGTNGRSAALSLRFNTPHRAASHHRLMQHPSCMRRARRGFTLIELMVVLVVVAILAAIAYPSYTQYLFRSRALPGTDALSMLAVRLEQRFQDVGGYGSGDAGSDDGACGVTLNEPPYFAITCASSDGGTRFLLTATGSGPVQGLVYTIDDSGVRRTPEHPRGAPADNCWSLRGGTCDS